MQGCRWVPRLIILVHLRCFFFNATFNATFSHYPWWSLPSGHYPAAAPRIPGKIAAIMKFPRLMLVRQKFPDRRIPDVAAEVRKQLVASGFAARFKPGARIAIGVGSRGIHNIATIVRSAVAYWKDQGMRPFLFPAMGSHGAATAAGQADVLAHYGITEP